MFATRHAVFVGPGRLPKELRDVLLRRQGAPQTDLPVNTVRLLAIFDSAVDAERICGQVQRLKIAAVVAGPEQPVAEAAWASVAEFSVDQAGPNLVLPDQTVPLREVTRATVIDWREGEGLDRGVLLHVGARRLFLRSSTMRVDRQTISTPAAGLRTLNEVVTELVRLGVPVQTRKLTPEELGAPTLTGDLLPLALAVVDALDQPVASLAPPPPLALTSVSHRGAWVAGLGGATIVVSDLLAGHPVVALAGVGLLAFAARDLLRSD